MAALKAGAASAAEGQLSNEELGITEANYATGRSNFNNAVGAEEGVAGQFGSGASSTMGGANTANKTAFGEASQIERSKPRKNRTSPAASRPLPRVRLAVSGFRAVEEAQASVLLTFLISCPRSIWIMADTTARDPLDVSPRPIPLPQTGALTPRMRK